MSRWNPERWQQAGVNEAGDPVYVRGAGEEAVALSAGGVHDLTKAELQELAEARGLPTSGTKAELIERLQG